MEKTPTEAQETYDAFASSYDDFNHAYMNERWTSRLLGLAEEAGLKGKRLLDVGCGTGLSFMPMLRRGWRVTGCDISHRMLERAALKAQGAVTLVQADMRDLPVLGEFDLVWAVNDAVNYLLDGDQLSAALDGMRRNLAPGGIVVFDVNTLATYRTFFSNECVVERHGRRFVWSGSGGAADAVQSGAIFEARFAGEGEGVKAHIHRQRHFGKDEVLASLRSAQMRCLCLAGETGGELEDGLDEFFHTKAVYACAAV